LNFFFIVPDGLNISGLLTWALNLRSITNKCKLLFLNQDSPLPGSFRPKKDFRKMDIFSSHDVNKIANKLEQFIKDFSEEKAVIIPTGGDSAFEAAHLLIEKWHLRKDSQPLRLIGTIFGDQDNPYNIISHYESSISTICGNSTEIISKLEAKFPNRKNDIFHWKPYIPSRSLSPNWKKGSPLQLLFAGRLDEKAKKVSRLPKICKELISLGVPFQLNIAGSGPETDSMIRSFKNLGEFKEANVRFLGALSSDELSTVFSTNHIFVLTSKSEGLPMALLEAMSSGLCPIAMEIPSGVSEIISHNKNGLLVPQGDIKAFALEIKKVFLDEQLLKKLRKRSLQFVRKNYGAKEHFNLLFSNASKYFSQKPSVPAKVQTFHNKFIAKVLKTIRKKNQKIGIFGTGMLGRKLVDQLYQQSSKRMEIFDTSLGEKNYKYRDIRINSPVKMPNFDLDVIILATSDFQNEMLDLVKGIYKVNSKEIPVIVSNS